MDRRVKVKEPPREGNPAGARYHLKDGGERGLIGWANTSEEAYDWLTGFGEWSTVFVVDRETRSIIRPMDKALLVGSLTPDF